MRSETPQTQGSGKDGKDKKEESKQEEEKKEGESSREQTFIYDEMPVQCKMFNALQPLHDMNILIQHVEAGYQVRKHLFDIASKAFSANVGDGVLNTFMALTGQKNKILNEKMDKFLAE